MAAIETISGFVTAPSTTFTAPTFSGGSATIRNFSSGNAWLLTAICTQNTSSGALRIRSPRLHDFVNGIRLQNPQANNMPLLPLGFPQRLIAQDTLTIEMTGSAVAADIINFGAWIYYESLDSANGRFIDLTDLETRMVNVIGVSHALVGGTAGVYGASQAINAGTSGDIFKANTDYALLGAVMSESAVGNGSIVRITGVDTGNLGIGIPVMQYNLEVCAYWFIELTKRFARPMIPVINSANKGGTVFDFLNNENANTVTSTSIWAELR